MYAILKLNKSENIASSVITFINIDLANILTQKAALQTWFSVLQTDAPSI